MKKPFITTMILIVILPVLYALLFRWIFDLDIIEDFVQVMSISFLFAVPFGIGMLTIAFSPVEKVSNGSYRIFMPWAPIMLFFFATLIFGFEGWACWVMIMPVFLVFASLGGITAGYFKLKKYRKNDRLNMSLALLLPVIMAPFEKTIHPNPVTYTAYTYIDISASRNTIWENVVRVKEIDEQEDRSTITRFLGFPRPVKAELDYTGVGGSRKAIFSKGLIFDEVVTKYQSQTSMHFTIRANPYDIPSITMDKHVVIGGDYFDVQDGAYELEQLSGSSYRLHLYSHFQLKTTFNFYSGWWATWIMKDIQNNILQIIKARCERK